MSSILSAENVGYSVRGKALVRDVSLAIAPGTIMIIVGPNGAGKSTLLKLLTGEIAPTHGSVRSMGEPISRVPAWRLACRRAVMAQASRLTFPFTVESVVRLGIDGLGRACARRDWDGMIEQALDAADLLPLAGRDYQSLSGGEQQRVQFARVMAQLEAGRSLEPKQALLLDEPIASLDLCHQLALLDKAHSLARTGRVAVLAILHDLNLAATYADHLVVMHNGRVAAAGTPSAILTTDMIRHVFGVALQPDAFEAGKVPVILPQFCLRVTKGPLGL